MYDPFVKHNFGAIKQIDKSERDRKIKLAQASNMNPKSGLFIASSDINSHIDPFPQKEQSEENYSMVPGSFMKIVPFKSKKPKSKSKSRNKRKPVRQHITAADLMVIGN